MLSLTELRSNLYQKIDTLIETGIPIELKRRGYLIKIVLEKKANKLDRLPKRDDFRISHPEDLIHHNWLKDWNNDLP